MSARFVYPLAGGEPKYYEQDGCIRELNGTAAFSIRGAEVYTWAGEKAYVIRKKLLYRHDSGQPELFFGD